MKVIICSIIVKKKSEDYSFETASERVFLEASTVHIPLYKDQYFERSTYYFTFTYSYQVADIAN